MAQERKCAALVMTVDQIGILRGSQRKAPLASEPTPRLSYRTAPVLTLSSLGPDASFRDRYDIKQ